MPRRRSMTGGMVRAEREMGEVARRECAAAEKVWRELKARIGDLREIESSRLSGPGGWVHSEDEALFEALAALDDIDAMVKEAGARIRSAKSKGAALAKERGYEMERREGRRAKAFESGPYDGEAAWRRTPGSACPACGCVLLGGPRQGELFCPRCRRLVSEPEEVRPPQRYKEGPWRRPPEGRRRKVCIPWQP